jgi:hypothetical protein
VLGGVSEDGQGSFDELCLGLLGERRPRLVDVSSDPVAYDALGHEVSGLQGLADQLGCVFSGSFCQWPVAPILEV